MDPTTPLRIAHDLSLAAWFGGAWMGAVGLNGATIEVDDHLQRTRVANAGWFRWAPIVGACLVTNVLTAGALGRLAPDFLGRSQGQRRRVLRSTVTIGAILATIETGVSGRNVVKAGDVPVATAVHSIADTPDEVKRAQARLRVAQWLVPAFTALIWIVNAFQDD